MKLLQVLSAAPVCGVSLDNVSVLRLDRLGGAAPGNKSFKLQPYLEQARRQGVRRLVSFGGAWSNHLHALAAIGAEQGLETVGIVRADPQEPATPMLEDAARAGMHIERVGRTAYRARNEQHYIERLMRHHAPCLIIPEGGASQQAAQACAAVAELVRQHAPPAAKIVLAVGTGTTLAGVVAALEGTREVIGVSALRGARDLDGRVQELLVELSPSESARWHLVHDYHCGGFGRVNAALRAFVLEFESVQGIPLDPVYTAKAMFAVHQMRQCAALAAGEPVVVVHTGGLQGRRGQSWMPALEHYR